MQSVILASSVVVMCVAQFGPHHYGGYGGFEDRGDRFNKYGAAHGDYGHQRGGFGKGYDVSDYGHADADKGYYGAGYGDRGYNAGHDSYTKGGAEAHGDSKYDEAARAAKDADGFKKYSYFTSGSGPEGTYSKGSYGSQGYEHADSKSKAGKGATGGGFKKGYNSHDEDHKKGHSAFDKSAADHSGFGKKYDASAYGKASGEYGSAGHHNDWKNAGSDEGHKAYGHGYGHH